MKKKTYKPVTSKTTHLIIGYGQIGKSVENVLKNAYAVVKHLGKDEQVEGRFDVLHIAFPYSNYFVSYVNAYKKRYLNPAGIVIVHSTVAIGTCDKIGAVSSPVRGKHPDLTGGIMSFEKAFGGPDGRQAAKVFQRCSVPCYIDPDNRSVEAYKLIDTTQYGRAVADMWRIYRFCKKHKLNFDTVYTWANQTYNAGYESLGMPQFKKYILKPMPGKIGGHCVIPNAEILAKLYKEEIATDLLKFNETL